MFKTLVAFCKTACILRNFDEHFSLRKLRQLLVLCFKGFEIMDMKKCAAIPLNIHASIRFFLFNNHKLERRKNVR